MEEESILLTTFSATQGNYEWIVMSFGLKNAPQIFQRGMDNIFKDLNHCCLIYIDCILVISKTIEQHKDDALTVIQRYIDQGIILLRTNTFMANKKSSF